MTLGGVTLNVRDLEAAKAFYGGLPGARLIRDEGGIASYSFGEGRISLRKSAEPGFHLEMESAAPKALSERASEIKGDKVFLTDPDGHCIEVETGTEDHGGAFFNPAWDEENSGLG